MNILPYPKKCDKLRCVVAEIDFCASDKNLIRPHCMVALHSWLVHRIHTPKVGSSNLPATTTLE